MIERRIERSVMSVRLAPMLRQMRLCRLVNIEGGALPATAGQSNGGRGESLTGLARLLDTPNERTSLAEGTSRIGPSRMKHRLR